MCQCVSGVVLCVSVLGHEGCMCMSAFVLMRECIGAGAVAQDVSAFVLNLPKDGDR